MMPLRISLDMVFLYFLMRILLYVMGALFKTSTFFTGIRLGKMVKIIKFLFFAQKVSSGMGALRPRFLGG